MKQQFAEKPPVLPLLFKLPLVFVPGFIQTGTFVTLLNRLLGQELKDDELDFMSGKVVEINVTDAGITLRFTLQRNQFRSAQQQAKTDLAIAGTVYDFLLLLSRKEDSDTLFFNRRLKLSGDTELGLYVKNFLDGMDVTERWRYLHQLSDRARRFAERFA